MVSSARMALKFSVSKDRTAGLAKKQRAQPVIWGVLREETPLA